MPCASTCSGLTGDEAAEVVGTSLAPVRSRAGRHSVADRTDGNPFFLVEYARLAGGPGLASPLGEPHPPAAVHDVLARRLQRPPGTTHHRLATASAIGRQFDLATAMRGDGACRRRSNKAWCRKPSSRSSTGHVITGGPPAELAAGGISALRGILLKLGAG